jgi:hypothetical protein
METQPDIGAMQDQMQQLEQSHLPPCLVRLCLEFEQSSILSSCIPRAPAERLQVD